MAIEIDAKLMNADWTKQAWDLGVHNVKDLRDLIERSGMTIKQFKRLPVYKLNRKKLRWLRKL